MHPWGRGGCQAEAGRCVCRHTHARTQHHGASTQPWTQSGRGFVRCRGAPCVRARCAADASKHTAALSARARRVPHRCLTRVLVVQHRVAVAERAALHVLPAQAHVVALAQQRRECERLGGRPVHLLACKQGGAEAACDAQRGSAVKNSSTQAAGACVLSVQRER